MWHEYTDRIEVFDLTEKMAQIPLFPYIWMALVFFLPLQKTSVHLKEISHDEKDF